MKRNLFFIALFTLPLWGIAQMHQKQDPNDTLWKTEYRAEYPKTNQLVHTKLDVRFDYDKSYMYGKEWLTLQPHFYPTDSVRLDAKGMEIKEVAILSGNSRKPLKYTYDNKQLNIHLDRTYTRNEKYTLYFEYTSKPDEVEQSGSAAITEAKGLYFINPRGEEPGKPTQIWTQGETEANSVWMITIDKPNQKTTEEIYMTVPAKYVTLSNGIKVSEKKNADGTRTDYWKMDLPHAPYLFFMGVGDYAIVKDKPFKGKEVSYYVEKDQAKYALGVFGHTPEMIKFFSEKLGIDFPWPKYSQIVGRDYVSGAMENTTATLHQESAYQDNRELIDGNAWESVIAHELFHQWFGDLVTTESWSNITVNESFANYSEYLWNEYKYGKDEADAHIFQDRAGYLMSGSNSKDLVRFFYRDKEDMFDAVSYNKGGSILHMLRNYVGDDAFFKALNLYLNTNKFKTGEAHQLRLAFEEVTGQDMNWFWNEWYFSNGQPKLKINYDYSTPGIAKVIVEQTQTDAPLFKMPVNIDVYVDGKKTRYPVWIKNKADSFSIPYSSMPELINFDGDKTLLAEITDNKTEANYIAQWKYAKTYTDRREAIDFFAKKNMPEVAKGLYDKYPGIRQYAINKIAGTPYKSDKVILEEVARMAKSDPDKKTKAAAINFLVKTKDDTYKPIYMASVTDSSYRVAGAALKALISLDPDNGYAMARKYGAHSKGALAAAASAILFEKGTDADFDIVMEGYKGLPPSFEKMGSSAKFAEYLSRLNNIENIKKGIDLIMSFRNMIPPDYRTQTDPMFKKGLDKISDAKGTEMKNYIDALFK